MLLPSLILSRSLRQFHKRNQSAQPPLFVELGAYNGITYSNTLMLEKCCSWSGVLLEANPFNFEQLNTTNRNATKVHSAVCDRNANGTVAFSATGGVFAGMVEVLGKTARRHAKGLTRVPCDTLTNLLERAHVHFVDFLSLDVEGSEELVLNNTNLHQIGFMVMEESAGATSKALQRMNRALSRAGLVKADMGKLSTPSRSSVWGRAGTTFVPVAAPYERPSLRAALVKASSIYDEATQSGGRHAQKRSEPRPLR